VKLSQRALESLNRSLITSAGEEELLVRASSRVRAALGLRKEDQLFFFPSHDEALRAVLEAGLAFQVEERGRTQLLAWEGDASFTLAKRVLLPYAASGMLIKPISKNSFRHGQIVLEQLTLQLTPRSAMISLGFAEPLTGVIQPIAQLADLCERESLLLHSDLSALWGNHFVRFDELALSFATLDGAAVGAPYAGAVAIARGPELSKKLASFAPLPKRAAMPVALAAAIEEALEYLDTLCTEVAALRSDWERRLKKLLPEIQLLSPYGEGIAQLSLFAMPGIQGDTLQRLLSIRGIPTARGGGCFPTLSSIMRAGNFSSQEAVSALSCCFTEQMDAALVDKWLRAIEGMVPVLRRIAAPLSQIPELHKDVPLSQDGPVTRKSLARLEALSYAGLLREASPSSGFRSIHLEQQSSELGCWLSLSWLVDESDGVIADIAFRAFGPPALLIAAEVACELALRKNYDQVLRIGADLLDRHLRDRPDQPSFGAAAASYLNLILDLIEQAARRCFDIPFADSFTTSPIDVPSQQSSIYPGWELLSSEQKLALVEELLTREVRPYIELDAGGIEVRSFEGDELKIAYQGNCTSCYSAIGGTLTAIQQVLRSRLHPALTVIPDLTSLALPQGGE